MACFVIIILWKLLFIRTICVSIKSTLPFNKLTGHKPCFAAHITIYNITTFPLCEIPMHTFAMMSMINLTMMLPLAQKPPLFLLLYLGSLTDIQKICTKKVVGWLKNFRSIGLQTNAGTSFIHWLGRSGASGTVNGAIIWLNCYWFNSYMRTWVQVRTRRWVKISKSRITWRGQLTDTEFVFLRVLIYLVSNNDSWLVSLVVQCVWPFSCCTPFSQCC